jgi:RNA polymerase sigma-70 factor (ECF subfamily)
MVKIKEKFDIVGLREGTSQSYQNMLDILGKTSLRIAQQFVGNYDDARDIVQKTVIKVMNKIDTLKDGMPFEPWYYRILMNTCRDWKRNYFFRFRNSLSSVQEKQIPAINEINDISEFVQREILAFPKKKRMIFILHYQEEFSVKEIAEMFNISENTIRVQLMKGRQYLRQQYEKNLKENKYDLSSDKINFGGTVR